MKQSVDIVSYPADASSDATSIIVAVRDSRQLATTRGKRAIVVSHVRDPAEAKQLRAQADFVAYEISARTTEKELRRIIDNKLCDLLIGAEQFDVAAGLHNQKIIFNHVIARICAEQGIIVVANLRPILFSTPKVGTANRLRYIAECCEKCGAQIIGATFAADELERRNPADLACILDSLIAGPRIQLTGSSTQSI